MIVTKSSSYPRSEVAGFKALRSGCYSAESLSRSNLLETVAFRLIMLLGFEDGRGFFTADETLDGATPVAVLDGTDEIPSVVPPVVPVDRFVAVSLGLLIDFRLFCSKVE